MNAPLYEALCAFAGEDGLRMHMPGHKGKAMAPVFSAAAIDYTELEPTGNLYTGEGPIAAAEELAARAWGAENAFFLTGGSTQGVMTGLALCAAPGSTIALDRNSHKSFFHAMALLDLHPVYLDKPEAALLEQVLTAHGEIRTVCITSPTYYGVTANIEALAAVCRAHGVRLLVDEAHGAHFPFVGRGPCAAGRGAAVSVSSAHKTLPALGGGALLFTDGSFSPMEVRLRASMFGTSSPSYPIMASMDWARDHLEGAGGARYRAMAEETAALRRRINARGVFHALCEEDGLCLDPTRLTVQTACAGLDGRAAGAFLSQQRGVWPEMENRDCVVFILTCADGPEDLARLERALSDMERLACGTPLPPCPLPPLPEICRSVRAALLAPLTAMRLGEACGRVSAVSVAPYPPGVPVVAPGERITEEILSYFRKIGYPLDTEIFVLPKGE